MGRPFVLRCDDCVTSDADTCSGIAWPHGNPGDVRRFGRTADRYPAIAQPYVGYPSVARPGDHTAPRLSTRQRHKMDTVRQPSSTTKPAVADGFITTVPPAGLEPYGCCCCCMCGWCRLVRMPRHLGIEPLLIIYCFGAPGVGEWLSPPVFAWGIRVWRCISGCLVAGGLGTVDLVVRRGSWRRMRGAPIGGGGLAR